MKQIRKNQKVIENQNDELEVKPYPKTKKRKINEKPKVDIECPSCKQRSWIEFDKSYFCQNSEFIVNKQKHKRDEKVLRQDKKLSTKLRYAFEKIRETYFSMMIIEINRTENMIDKVQRSKGKTKLRFHQGISDYYDEMNYRKQSGFFQFEEDPSAINAQGIDNLIHEALLIIKFLQTKPQIKSMNINYFDLYYTVIKNLTAEWEKWDLR